jgi:Mn-dependent DtxR family transcriptional regulator
MDTNAPNLDLQDKAILRTMLRSEANKRPLSTLQIAKKTGINWKTAFTHLNKLSESGYVISEVSGKVRQYVREGKQVEAQREIKWRLNV